MLFVLRHMVLYSMISYLTHNNSIRYADGANRNWIGGLEGQGVSLELTTVDLIFLVPTWAQWISFELT